MAYNKVLTAALSALIAITMTEAQSIVSQNVAGDAGLYGSNIYPGNLGGVLNYGYPNSIIQSGPVGVLSTSNVVGSLVQPLAYANAYPYGIGNLPLGYAQNNQLAVQNVAISNNNCQSCGYQGPLVYPDNGNCGSCGNCGKVIVV